MNISLLDKIIVVAGFCFCVFVYFWFWQTSSTMANGVEIKSPNKTQHFSLFENRVLNIVGPLGMSQIEIKDGQARFLSSPCKNQICVLAGWLKQSGQISVCLPNAVSLQVLGDEQYDAINF